jgi:16S rRNA U1498 N3-methylase RsmE
MRATRSLPRFYVPPSAQLEAALAAYSRAGTGITSQAHPEEAGVARPLQRSPSAHGTAASAAATAGAAGKNAMLKLDSAQGHQAVNVLRLRVGDPLRVFHPSYGEWAAEVLGGASQPGSGGVAPGAILRAPAGRGARAGSAFLAAPGGNSSGDVAGASRSPAGGPTVRLLEPLRPPLPAPAVCLHLFYAPLGRPRRQAFLVEKAVELGAASLTPMATERGLVELVTPEGAMQGRTTAHGTVRPRHGGMLPPPPTAAAAGSGDGKAAAVVVEAAEQSERLSIPVLGRPLTLDHLLALWTPPAAPALPATDCDASLGHKAEFETPAAEANEPFRPVHGGTAQWQPRVLLICDEEAAVAHAARADGTAADQQARHQEPWPVLLPHVALALGPLLAAHAAKWGSGKEFPTGRKAEPLHVGLLVGPEGGWSASERALFSRVESLTAHPAASAAPSALPLPASSGAVRRVSLGSGVLRAETAALAAIAMARGCISAAGLPFVA